MLIEAFRDKYGDCLIMHGFSEHAFRSAMPSAEAAKLLAAAPDLLQILEAIVEDVGYGGGGAKLCENFLSRSKSAIAKAKGGA